MQKATLGLIAGNRGFFPDHLAGTGREDMVRVLERAGCDVVATSAGETKCGAVETRAEAKACAALLRENREKLDGVIVTLPNFGDEKAIAEALRLAGLKVPVLIQATPDDPRNMLRANRRDSFCGKISVCNNLRQCGIPFSLTTHHTEAPESEAFANDLAWFAGVCRVVKGLRRLRIGAVGTRPAPFNTVRYSEKILEASGITVEPVDLSVILARINRLGNNGEVTAKMDEIRSYVAAGAVPGDRLRQMAKLALVLDEWMRENEITVTAFQCWTVIEELLGVVPCAVMSILSERLMPSACEVDVCGAIAMYALTLASGTPSALLDWNNNYADCTDKAVLFHCSNLPKSFFEDARMSWQEILADTVGKENSFGTCVGRIKTGPVTYARFTTEDHSGRIRGYVGEACITSDPLQTFGGYGVIHIPKLSALLRHICENGFEHHVAANLSQTARILHEAAVRYLDWQVYWHGQQSENSGGAR